MPFSQLGLSSTLLNAIHTRGYVQATAIQQDVIPVVLSGRDVLATAQTGSGKTAAYCLPLLENYVRAQANKSTKPNTRVVQSLILVPTRELAVQVGDTLRSLGQNQSHPAKLAVLFGGISINPQMLHLRGGADIVVATPGRLLDLVSKNAIKLDQVTSLILDEADRMLALGFADELKQILALLPSSRQSCFFSATFAPNVADLAEGILRDPARINIPDTDESTPDITQRAIIVEATQRTQLLRHLFQTEKWSRVLVFVATKYTADLLSTKLRRAHISAEAFHGEQTQGKRSQVISDFKASRVKILVATDVAARGIDIYQLPVVVNFDLPRSSDDYTHRIGRTGRAGEAGLAVNFICADAANEAHFRLIEKRHGIKIAREQIEGFIPDEISLKQTQTITPTDPNGGIKGKRPNKKDKLRALQSQTIAQE
ncbi:DEAD/DEAH box helicase [Undibacterium flavidum]|uniref:DEAD/DEAH box helicase n=1 Tax=Undibacterium flavidum TaxID=2762297 RepID=A0ABR6Y7X8_9BURK|nr:DEAD/DEAH box helicase [Undibacterium flavidum]MBC3872693.1 DEAD/DEAH box helicase [Undibacterium flavidum]